MVQERWGAEIPLARVENGKGVVLRTEGGRTYFCRVYVDDSLFTARRWKHLKDRYAQV